MGKKSMELMKAENVFNRSESREVANTSEQITLHCIGQKIVHTLSKQAAEHCQCNSSKQNK